MDIEQYHYNLRIFVEISILVILLLFLIFGCAAMVSVTTATNSLLDAKEGYSRARQELRSNWNLFTYDEQIELDRIETDANDLVSRISDSWDAKNLISLDDADRLYWQGAAIYTRAKNIIAPVYHSLSASAQLEVAMLDSSLTKLRVIYKEYESSPDARRQAQLLSNGIEIARLALRVGVLLL